MSGPTDYVKKNPAITTDFSIVGCLWKSVGKIVWCELGFNLLKIYIHITVSSLKVLSHFVVFFHFYFHGSIRILV